MRSFLTLFTVFLLAAGSVGGVVHAQDDLESFVARETAAFVVIQDPEAILEQIEESVFLRNRHFQKALDLMVDEEFPLTTPEQLTKLESKWDAIRQLLSKFDEVSVIIHSWPDEPWSIPKLTIALTGSGEIAAELETQLTEAQTSIAGAESGDPVLFSLLAGSQLSGITIQQSGNLLLVSNAPEQSQKLKARIEQSTQKKFRSLARSRSFQTVQKLLEQRAEEPQVRGFIAPQSFRKVITTLVAGDNFIMIDPPKSIASAGFQILLQYDSETTETPDGVYQPVINWDFVLTYTRPSTGFGKLIESFEPFEEMPSLPFPVTSLEAVGFDLNAKHDAGRDIFEVPKAPFCSSR